MKVIDLGLPRTSLTTSSVGCVATAGLLSF